MVAAINKMKNKMIGAKIRSKVTVARKEQIEQLGTCGQSYKHFTLVNYDSRGVVTRELPVLRL